MACRITTGCSGRPGAGPAAEPERQPAGEEMEPDSVANHIPNALVEIEIDKFGEPFKGFQRRGCPFGEPQLLKRIAGYLNRIKICPSQIIPTKRTADLLIEAGRALELKIARRFGDNDKKAANWSVNLLHPSPSELERGLFQSS